MLGFAILCSFYFIGIMLHELFSIPLPANVIALILFTLCLFLKVIKIEWVEAAAQLLLKHLLLFFVPFLVSMIIFFPLLGQYWISLTISLVGSTLLVLLVTGWISQLLQPRNKEEEQHGRLE